MKDEGGRMKVVFWLGWALVLTGCLGVETVVTVPAPTAAVTATAVPATSEPIALPTSEPTNQPTSQPIAQPTDEPRPAPTTASEASSMNQANADVLFVRAVQTGDETWTFSVTAAHPDTGWEDYADGWDVLLPDGAVILPNPDNPFTRLLVHPHVDEQPFTRSQSRIVIPEEVTAVTVRAHDLLDGFGGQEVTVDLTVDSGPNFEVEKPGS